MEKKACSSSSTADWTLLPRDIVFTIIDMLVSLPDFIRFGCVCKSWNASSLNYNNERLIPLSNLQLPWLLVKDKKRSDSYECLCLYDIINAEICKFHYHSVPYAYYCYGSYWGWLFYMEGHSLVLRNPLSNTIIRLPPFDSRKFEIEEVYSFMLSSDPSLGPFEVIAISCFRFHALAHLNSSDEFWTYQVTQHEDLAGGCFNVIFHRDRIIGVNDSTGQVYSLVVTDDDVDASTKCIKLKEIAPSCIEVSDINNVQSHIVETTRGHLLLVLRYFDSCPTTVKTFKIYKLVLDSDHGQVERIPIVNLGGDSLFLGTRNCISILASMYPGCSPNSIYWAAPFTLQVFNLENESVSTISISEDYAVETYPTWIVPSVKL